MRDDGADEYDSGEEVTRTKDDDDFIDGEDDLEDVLGEYDQEQQVRMQPYSLVPMYRKADGDLNAAL